MQYFITFLEGLITFVSPCVLPMLPVYVMYFAGGSGDLKSEPGGRRKTLIGALGFVAGFTVIFVLLGVFASSVNSLLVRYKTAVNIVCGAIVTLFGLHYAGLLRIPFLDRTLHPNIDVKPSGFLPALLFGAVFAIGWSPCTGAFLGSALLMASQTSRWFSGMLLLLCYSAGLGIPFIACAILIDSLKSAFGFIKRHYRVINIICGSFLILVGILMMTGIFARITASLA